MSSIPSQEAMNQGLQLGYIYLTVRDKISGECDILAVCKAEICRKITIPNGDSILFRIKKTSKLQKLMDAYCELQSLDTNSVSFFVDRNYLLGWQTPGQVGMENGGEIDALMHQTGGGGPIGLRF